MNKIITGVYLAFIYLLISPPIHNLLEEQWSDVGVKKMRVEKVRKETSSPIPVSSKNILSYKFEVD